MAAAFHLGSALVLAARYCEVLVVRCLLSTAVWLLRSIGVSRAGGRKMLRRRAGSGWGCWEVSASSGL